MQNAHRQLSVSEIRLVLKALYHERAKLQADLNKIESRILNFEQEEKQLSAIAAKANSIFARKNPYLPEVISVLLGCTHKTTQTHTQRLPLL